MNDQIKSCWIINKKTRNSWNIYYPNRVDNFGTAIISEGLGYGSYTSFTVT